MKRRTIMLVCMTSILALGAMLIFALIFYSRPASPPVRVIPIREPFVRQFNVNPSIADDIEWVMVAHEDGVIQMRLINNSVYAISYESIEFEHYDGYGSWFPIWGNITLLFEGHFSLPGGYSDFHIDLIGWYYPFPLAERYRLIQTVRPLVNMPTIRTFPSPSYTGIHELVVYFELDLWAVE